MRTMEQPGSERTISPSCIVSVSGLHGSGKTTVAEALVAELASRGYRVGCVKTIRHRGLALDAEGTDTRRHAAAGAEFVIALLDREIAYFEPRSDRPSLRDARRLFRPGVQVVVWEGDLEEEAKPVRVVCLKSAEDLARTLETRGIPAESVAAVSGVAAAGFASAGFASAGFASGAGRPPAFDVTDPGQRRALADVVIGRCGAGRE